MNEAMQEQATQTPLRTFRVTLPGDGEVTIDAHRVSESGNGSLLFLLEDASGTSWIRRGFAKDCWRDFEETSPLPVVQAPQAPSSLLVN